MQVQTAWFSRLFGRATTQRRAHGACVGFLGWLPESGALSAALDSIVRVALRRAMKTACRLGPVRQSTSGWESAPKSCGNPQSCDLDHRINGSGVPWPIVKLCATALKMRAPRLPRSPHSINQVTETRQEPGFMTAPCDPSQSGRAIIGKLHGGPSCSRSISSSGVGSSQMFVILQPSTMIWLVIFTATSPANAFHSFTIEPGHTPGFS